MDKDFNVTSNAAAAAARKKRKFIIESKESSKYSKVMSKHSVANQLPITPLSDVTNRFINKHNIQTQSRTIPHSFVNSDRYTPQPSSQQQQCRNKQATSIQSLGVNLFNQFSNASGTSSSSCLPHVSTTEGSCSKGKSPSTNENFNHVENIANYSLSNEDSESSTADDSEGDDEDSEVEHDSENLQSNYTYRPNPLPDKVYFNIGLPIYQCPDCGAQMWYQERSAKGRHSLIPKFQICCGQGKVQIPLLKDPPQVLQELLFNIRPKHSKNYQQNTRIYNAMFAFTSPGFKIDNNFGGGRGPPTIRIQGQPCHRIGSLLPKVGEQPKFAQLYIYDTANETQNRLNGFSNNNDVDPEIVTKLGAMLDEHNVIAKSFRMARDRLKDENVSELKLKLISDRTTDGRIYNQPTVSEVAALIVGDIDTAGERDIILETQGGELQRIDEFHTNYLGYQYPLIFPYGEDGYRPDIPYKKRKSKKITVRNRVTIKDWLCYRIQYRINEAMTLLGSRRLFQQFLVDGYTMVESERLNYLRNNQSKLRVGKYNNLSEPQSTEPNQSKKRGKRVVLPSSFVGGKRYMDQLYFDGMSISAAVGFPDLFITFTCNPSWPEIKQVLNQFNLKPQDRPDLITRVFKIKLDELMADLTKKHVLGKVVAYMYTIEFQKRGLPHAHILIFLHPSSKYPSPDDINKIISAEIPNPESENELYQLVKSQMIHGPCGLANKSSPCMKSGKCSKYYPKKFQEKTIVDQEGYPVYRRRADGAQIEKNGILLDNRHVVPYNPGLLLKYQAHINMEWCNQSQSIKYLFKYINKGYDRITATIVKANKTNGQYEEEIDEIKQFLDCRYISPTEACWRIFGFPIHGRKPAVERLFFHLLGQQSVYYTDYERIHDVLLKPSVTQSMFTSWFEANNKYTEARDLTYAQFVSRFVYDKKQRAWKPRKRGYTIGRLIWVPPCTGELYYLRMMLTVVKGPLTYDSMKKVGDTTLDSFRDACFAKGFLDDDQDFIVAIKQASQWATGFYLRKLFVTMLLTGSVNRPNHVWLKTRQWLSDSILYEQRRISNNKDLLLSDEEIWNLTLQEIEKLLQRRGKSLKKDFPCMPLPRNLILKNLGNKLIYDERNYDRVQLRQEFHRLFQLLTDEQKLIFDKIINKVYKRKGGVFFLHGYGGTGKTFMWNTLASCLRSRGHIVLTVASSGIASLLLPGGRTAHSKFKIPVPTLDNSCCKIEFGDEHAQMLRQASLIIWDEAPMAHKFTFEALNTTLKDVMCDNGNSEEIFGGKVMIFGGDFRQILPVVPRGSRSDIIHASLNSSKIWYHVEVLTLTKNMRLQQGLNDENSKEIDEFSKWLLKVGEGKLSEPNDGYAEIEIPKEHLLKNEGNPINTIVESTYPNLVQHYKDPEYLHSKAILASTIDVVDEINDYILKLIPGEEQEFLSGDSVDRSEVDDNHIYDVLTPEFLNSLRCSGLPNHRIKLKIGTPIMLMRNLDQAEGLCNGTRLIVTNMASHVLEAKIISGTNIGEMTYIPRMSMSPSESPWPFKLSRRQFPIIVSYAMTINKSQGQSLDSVGLYLPRPVFSHGQLYVAMSRVKRKGGLKILINDPDNPSSSTTTNVVFKEVFRNL